MNKKQLYENIMNSISKTIKKTLNEAYQSNITQNDVDQFLEICSNDYTPWKKAETTNQVRYKLKVGTIDISLVTNLQHISENPMLRHEYSCSSRADNHDCYLQILDFHKGHSLDSFDEKYEGNKKIFEALFNENFREANDGKCAQWGTWKFIFDSPEDLHNAALVIKDIIQNEED